MSPRRAPPFHEMCGQYEGQQDQHVRRHDGNQPLAEPDLTAPFVHVVFQVWNMRDFGQIFLPAAWVAQAWRRLTGRVICS